MKLLIATRNQGKLKEFKFLLQSTPHSVISLSQTDLPLDFKLPEIGRSFKANAVLIA